MELRRFIFEVRYKPKFAWFDKRGVILELLVETKMFDGLGQSAEVQVMAEQEQGEIWRNFQLNPQKMAGAIEASDIRLKEILEFIHVFRKICDTINLARHEIIRVGVRFFFTKSIAFDTANSFLLNSISSDIRNILGNEFVDSALIPVVKYGDHKCQYMLGLIKKEEYGKFFKRPAKIEYEEGCLFDIDYNSQKFQSLSFEAFVQEGYAKIEKTVVALEQELERYAKQQG